jgi:hypothetical protein
MFINLSEGLGNRSPASRWAIKKLREMLKIKHRFFYPRENFHALSIHLFKYIQCITLFLEKMDAYDNYIAKYCVTENCEQEKVSEA